jgi:N-acyl homoserine lactone hydrolase
MATIDMLLHGFSLGSDQGSLGFCGVTLLRGTKTILIDASPPGRRQLLLQKLQERGLTPDDIDYLFLTHAHWDHMLNVDLFPNATILIHPRERDYCKAPREGDWATLKYATLVLESRRLQEVVEGEEIDDGVRVIETPGHSAGSMALLVRGDGGTAAISGDALPNSWSVSAGVPRNIFWDVAEAKSSIAKLLNAAQTFYPGHDRPFRVQDSKVAYLEPTNVRIVGWPDSGEGEGPAAIAYAAEPFREALIHSSATR